MLKPWFEQFKNDFKNKKVLILGLGLLGRGINDAKFFCEIGAQVTVTDLKNKAALQPALKKINRLPIKFIFGQHRNSDILNSDLIIRNAAIPQNSPFLKLARKHSILVEMDESLFAKYAPVKIIGITGTRGKSTTTMMIYKILKEANFPVWLGGNILTRATLPLLNKVNKNDWVVMELSSWQLQGFKEAQISPSIAVITNLYEDHLNRYSSMSSYIADKKAIFKFQNRKNWLFINRDLGILNQITKKAKGQIIKFDKTDLPKNWILKLPGDHNRLNASGALKVCRKLGVDKRKIKKVLDSFSGLPYRLEKIGSFKGVEYYNDTTSTTPIAGIMALKAINKPLILICGGSSKKLKMIDFAKAIVERVKNVIFLEGTETSNLVQLVKKFGGKNKILGRFNNLNKAVLKAKSHALPGEVILLSPGCASFGMFKNEFDRGEQFNKIVSNFNAKKRLD